MASALTEYPRLELVRSEEVASTFDGDCGRFKDAVVVRGDVVVAILRDDCDCWLHAFRYSCPSVQRMHDVMPLSISAISIISTEKVNGQGFFAVAFEVPDRMINWHIDEDLQISYVKTQFLRIKGGALKAFDRDHQNPRNKSASPPALVSEARRQLNPLDVRIEAGKASKRLRNDDAVLESFDGNLTEETATSGQVEEAPGRCCCSFHTTAACPCDERSRTTATTKELDRHKQAALAGVQRLFVIPHAIRLVPTGKRHVVVSDWFTQQIKRIDWKRNDRPVIWEWPRSPFQNHRFECLCIVTYPGSTIKTKHRQYYLVAGDWKRKELVILSLDQGFKISSLDISELPRPEAMFVHGRHLCYLNAAKKKLFVFRLSDSIHSTKEPKSSFTVRRQAVESPSLGQKPVSRTPCSSLKRPGMKPQSSSHTQSQIPKMPKATCKPSSLSGQERPPSKTKPEPSSKSISRYRCKGSKKSEQMVKTSAQFVCQSLDGPEGATQPTWSRALSRLRRALLGCAVVQRAVDFGSACRRLVQKIPLLASPRQQQVGNAITPSPEAEPGDPKATNVTVLRVLQILGKFIVNFTTAAAKLLAKCVHEILTLFDHLVMRVKENWDRDPVNEPCLLNIVSEKLAFVTIALLHLVVSIVGKCISRRCQEIRDAVMLGEGHQWNELDDGDKF